MPQGMTNVPLINPQASGLRTMRPGPGQSAATQSLAQALMAIVGRSATTMDKLVARMAQNNQATGGGSRDSSAQMAQLVDKNLDRIFAITEKERDREYDREQREQAMQFQEGMVTFQDQLGQKAEQRAVDRQEAEYTKRRTDELADVKAAHERHVDVIGMTNNLAKETNKEAVIIQAKAEQASQLLAAGIASRSQERVIARKAADQIQADADQLFSTGRMPLGEYEETLQFAAATRDMNMPKYDRGLLQAYDKGVKAIGEDATQADVLSPFLAAEQDARRPTPLPDEVAAAWADSPELPDLPSMEERIDNRRSRGFPDVDPATLPEDDPRREQVVANLLDDPVTQKTIETHARVMGTIRSRDLQSKYNRQKTMQVLEAYEGLERYLAHEKKLVQPINTAAAYAVNDTLLELAEEGTIEKMLSGDEPIEEQILKRLVNKIFADQAGNDGTLGNELVAFVNGSAGAEDYLGNPAAIYTLQSMRIALDSISTNLASANTSIVAQALDQMGGDDPKAAAKVRAAFGIQPGERVDDQTIAMIEQVGRVMGRVNARATQWMQQLEAVGPLNALTKEVATSRRMMLYLGVERKLIDKNQDAALSTAISKLQDPAAMEQLASNEDYQDLVEAIPVTGLAERIEMMDVLDRFYTEFTNPRDRTQLYFATHEQGGTLPLGQLDPVIRVGMDHILKGTQDTSKGERAIEAMRTKLNELWKAKYSQEKATQELRDKQPQPKQAEWTRSSSWEVDPNQMGPVD